MVDWLKGCDICNIGLLETMDDFVKSGKSIRETSRILADEANREIGFDLYSSDILRKRYEYYKSRPKVGENLPPKKSETKDKSRVDEITNDIKRGRISDDDLKSIVDTVADGVDAGNFSPRVISRSSKSFNDKFNEGKKRLEKKGISPVVSMVDGFFHNINKLDSLVGRGPETLNDSDRKILTGEFRMLIPRLIKILLNMGFDIIAITNEIIKRRIERGNNEKNTKGNTQEAIQNLPDKT